MANKKKTSQLDPAKAPEPRQQMQDDGSQDAETFANIEPDSAQSFANINPADQ